MPATRHGQHVAAAAWHGFAGVPRSARSVSCKFGSSPATSGVAAKAAQASSIFHFEQNCGEAQAGKSNFSFAICDLFCTYPIGVWYLMY
jgi:hypothetical protein